MVSLRYSPPFRHECSLLQTQVTIFKNDLGSYYFSIKFLFETKQCPSLESSLNKLMYQAPLEGKARWACGHKCCSDVYYIVVCSFPWPLFSTSGGWYFNKTLSLAEKSFNLSFSSCVLVQDIVEQGLFQLGVFMFIDLFCWPMDETEPSLRRKSMAASVQFLLIKYLQWSCFFKYY